ncbi:hypothetical protein FKF97_16510 [Clostridium perfringens]|nr:hypothetical protein [Clostridium perfringens]
MYQLTVFQNPISNNYCIGTNVMKPDKVALNISLNSEIPICFVLGGKSTLDTNRLCGTNYNLIIEVPIDSQVPNVKAMMVEAIKIFDH